MKAPGSYFRCEASIHRCTHTRVQHKCLPLSGVLKVSWVSSSEFPSSSPVTLMRELSSHLAKQYAVVYGCDKRWPLNSLWTCSCVGEQPSLFVLGMTRTISCQIKKKPTFTRTHTHVSKCMMLPKHTHSHPRTQKREYHSHPLWVSEN